MKSNNVAGSLGARRSPNRTRSSGSKFLPPLAGAGLKDGLASSSQDASRIRAGYQTAAQDRKSLAVQILKEGRAQAFLDFFELSGGSDSTSSSSARSGDSGSLSPESLILLQQHLRRADAALSVGDKEQAFDAYRHMGLFFKQMGHREKAKTFFQKSLQVAISCGWLEAELEASCALGLVYEELHQPGLAARCHERCLALAQQLGREADVQAAQGQLVQVFAQQAEQQEAAGQLDEAAARYQQCITAAQYCGDLASAGAAHYHLGLIHQQKGDWQQALEQHRCYLETSRQLGDKAAEGAACCAYAECQQQLGELEGAVHSLEEYLELSSSQDPRGQAIACCKLGVLHHQQARMQQAVDYLARFYELARSLGEQRLLDVARVNLGVAKAGAKMGAYIPMVQTDLAGLLRWKNTRN